MEFTLPTSVKIILTAPSADGINGSSTHKTWFYLHGVSKSMLSLPKVSNVINKKINDFVMKTGVNRDMVTVTIETEEDSHE